MINKHYKKVKVAAPILNLLTDGPYMEKVLIKNIYPTWNGESVQQIAENNQSNPFTLRIGTPSMDRHMSTDSVYFVTKFLSYNPGTKQIESRNLIDGRYTKKVYIGEQTVDELTHKDYQLFVNGNVVANDIVLLHTKESLADKIRSLEQQMRFLQAEIIKITKQAETQAIYRQ